MKRYHMIGGIPHEDPSGTWVPADEAVEALRSERELSVRVQDSVEAQLRASTEFYEQKVLGLEQRLAGTYRKLMDAPELNMRNYTEDQVAALNDAVCEVCCDLEDVAALATAEEKP